MERRAQARNRCAAGTAGDLRRRSCYSRRRSNSTCTPVGKQRPYAQTE